MLVLRVVAEVAAAHQPRRSLTRAALPNAVAAYSASARHRPAAACPLTLHAAAACPLTLHAARQGLCPYWLRPVIVVVRCDKLGPHKRSQIECARKPNRTSATRTGGGGTVKRIARYFKMQFTLLYSHAIHSVVLPHNPPIHEQLLT